MNFMMIDTTKMPLESPIPLAEFSQKRNWSPFVVTENGKHAPGPRAINTQEGVCDRLRAAAFAEVQARDAFFWAAETFPHEAPSELCEAWKALAREEQKHLDWLLARLHALGETIASRPVSDHLWLSLVTCKSAREFALFMAGAEDRGRQAGERFHRDMLANDPTSAAIFGQIALEERSHIELAERFYGSFRAAKASVKN
jgi:uncharacterized ferritin-like protein (DUF455 family)